MAATWGRGTLTPRPEPEPKDEPKPKLMVTKGSAWEHNTTGETPSDHPNVTIVVRPWYVRVLTRFTYAYISAFAGIWASLAFAPAITDQFPIMAGGQQLWLAAQLALFAVIPVTLKNVLVFLKEYDQSLPDLAG